MQIEKACRSNVTQFGIFTVIYEKKIPLLIKKNNLDIPFEVYDSENMNVVAILKTETNYSLLIGPLMRFYQYNM